MGVNLRKSPLLYQQCSLSCVSGRGMAAGQGEGRRRRLSSVRPLSLTLSHKGLILSHIFATYERVR
jgi:hypothetical protein